MIIILFGLPGSGKNFVAEIFRDDFGFHLYDADKSLPPAAFRAIRKKRFVSEATRHAFYKKLAKKAEQLERRYGGVVMPRTFTYDRSRRYFKKLLPQSRFILVETNCKIRYQRIVNRDHHIDLKYAKKFENIFEKPAIPHFVLKNTHRGRMSLKRRVSRILMKVD